MTNEEKLQRLLEMQDHPERYTEEEIRQQMADEECRQLYEQMVRGADAVFAEAEVADATNGSSDHPVLRTTFLLRRGKKYLVAANIIGVLMLSGIAYAAIHIISNVGVNMKSQPQETQVLSQQPQRPTQSIEEITDSIPQTRRLASSRMFRLTRWLVNWPYIIIRWLISRTRRPMICDSIISGRGKMNWRA